MLIVEDDASSRAALRILLQNSGFHVTTAATLAAGLAAIDETIDTVVLDLMLPDGDGAHLLEHVRNSGLHARVCVTTGVNNPAALANLRQLNPDCILKKPIDFEQLLKSL